MIIIVLFSFSLANCINKFLHLIKTTINSIDFLFPKYLPRSVHYLQYRHIYIYRLTGKYPSLYGKIFVYTCLRSFINIPFSLSENYALGHQLSAMFFVFIGPICSKIHRLGFLSR